jgi:hypothetical protein
MSGVFQNIDPPLPHRPASVYHPLLVRGKDTLAGWRGGGWVNILDDARHSSVLYMCKYFVLVCYDFCKIMDHSCSDFDFFEKM